MKKEQINMKRHNTAAEFNAEKITDAIAKAGLATGEFGFGVAKNIMQRVIDEFESEFDGAPDGHMPDVELVQDRVVLEIFRTMHIKTGGAYLR